MFPRGVNSGLRRQQGILLGVTIIVFALGVVAGTMALQLVSPETAQNLAQHLDLSLQELQGGSGGTAVPVERTVRNHLETVGLIWFSGLIVIGAPLVLLLVFLRGAVLGFTVAFLLTYHGSQGVALVLVGILPSSLLFLPLVWVVGAVALGFSVSMVRNRGSGAPLGPMVGAYLAAGLGLAVLSGLLGWLEGVLTPWLVKGVLQYVG